MNGLVRFMASAAGRGIRIVAGIGLIAWGLFGGEAINVYFIGVGILPLLSGTLDICVVALLLGCPISGAKVRASNG